MANLRHLLCVLKRMSRLTCTN